MKVLVINSGSSSLKYQLIDMETEGVIAKGLCERIGIAGSKLTHKANGKELVKEQAMPSHNEAVALVLGAQLQLQLRLCLVRSPIRNTA